VRHSILCGLLSTLIFSVVFLWSNKIGIESEMDYGITVFNALLLILLCIVQLMVSTLRFRNVVIVGVSLELEED
jgi:hypothetical protein